MKYCLLLKKINSCLKNNCKVKQKTRKAFNFGFTPSSGAVTLHATAVLVYLMSCPCFDVPLSWASMTFSHDRSQTFSLWSDYVLHACTHQRPSHSDHVEFLKCLLKCHFFTVSEMFSWWIKTSQRRYLTALVDFNRFCRFFLSYLIWSKYLQKDTAKSDYIILGENIGFLLSTAGSEEA